MSKEFTCEPAFLTNKIVIDLKSPVVIEILPSDTGRMYLLAKGIDEEDCTISDSYTFTLTYEMREKVKKTLRDIVDPSRWSKGFYLYIPDREFASVEINSAVGNIKVHGLTAGSALFSGKLGNISISSVNAGELSCSLNNGNLSIEDTFAANRIDGKTELGNISAQLRDANYNVSAVSKLGNVSVEPGASVPGYTIPANFVSKCGNISVRFADKKEQ